MKSFQVLCTIREDSNSELKLLKGKLRTATLLRLVVFILTAAAVWYTWYTAWLTLALLGLGAALFLVSVRYHAQLRDRFRLESAFNELATIECDIMPDTWRSRPGGERYMDASHPFVNDLNVFGNHSLFQFINRCQQPRAEALLAEWLKSPLENIANIERERDTIRHFSMDPAWSLRYLAHARMAKAVADEDASSNPKEGIHHLPENHQSSGAHIFIFNYLLSAVMVTITVAYLIEFIDWNTYLIALLIAGGITASKLKKHQMLFRQWELLFQKASGFRGMLSLLRARSFEGSPLSAKFDKIQLADSEEALKRLERIKGAIDSRGNVLVGMLLNLLLFWDFQCARRLSKWQSQYGHLLADWQQLTEQVEAYQSFALHRFQHPGHCDVQWSVNEGIYCEEARHPLLGSESIPNDIELRGTMQFAIITGANMAGKSTYLRTVGLLALMAMRGLPVPALQMQMRPMKLFTSMLTTDNLGEQASYFFSELRRLRSIVDALEAGHPHLIILDEILKGTNSVDKAEGSRLFMEKLLQLPATGFIATHDLSLCTLAEVHPKSIKNLSFEVEFEQGALHFDYKLRDGICQNMNASFLLKEMGLV